LFQYNLLIKKKKKKISSYLPIVPNQVQLQLNWSIALRFKQGKALSHIGWSGHAEWANSALFVERKTFLGGK
jgi:hypothetical protein